MDAPEAPPPPPTLPEVTEILYAITDVHGCRDLLERAYDRIVEHAEGRPARVIFLGDAIDRGPDSKGVIDRLVAGAGAENFAPQINLIGNHEAFMMDAMAGDSHAIGAWLRNGGDATLASYGAPPNPVAIKALTIPKSHIQWLSSLRYVYETPTHIFVHAGLPFGVSLADALAKPERREQLIWIREPFLSVNHDFGRHVVHGHSPIGLADFRTDPLYRTNLDSGAVYGGSLSIGVFMPGVPGKPEVLKIEHEVVVS